MDFNKKSDAYVTPIAIIGVGCLFPKAEGLQGYWRLLFQGIDGITDIPDSHWSPEEYYHSDPKTPDHTYCKRGGFLSPVSFDPSEFGIPPSSLEATDTSQILALVAAKMALDDSGYGENGRSFDREKTSVILGVTGTQELVLPLGARLGFPKWRKALHDSGVSLEKTEEVISKISSSYVSWQEGSFPGLLGNVVAGRICNRLDLGGTNCVVDAACASSMSAIHLAIMELSSGRSSMVITGGVDTLNDIFMYMCFSKTHTLSPTGDARPFSKDADGTVLGEGVGLIILKRLDEAERDNDKIYAVIKSMGTSSDGKSQSIYAPRVEGQVKALQRAYEFTDIDPATVELIEAHGTGTRVGDITEFKALHQFFSNSGKRPSSCALGSVKSMIGHTKSAAGAAGLIKSALALHHKVLPPTLKAHEPDPHLGLDQSPFYLNTDTRPWLPSHNYPRRCGVSAFGFGGSNFHVVLEEYTREKKEIAWDGSIQIFALSASTKQELIAKMLEHKHAIDTGATWQDISRMAAKTRNEFSGNDHHRLLLVFEPLRDESAYLADELPSLFRNVIELLQTNSTDSNWSLPNAFYGGPEDPGSIAFIFPGQGSQYVNMGKDLACIFPEALDSISHMDNTLTGSHQLKDILFPIPSYLKNNKNRCDEILRETNMAQPAIGAISLSMLKILQRFHIRPDAVCGHSFGELTALHAAGWIDEETFCNLSIARGDVMANAGKDKRHDTGTMLAVFAPVKELADLVNKTGHAIVLANKNSPDQGVISGPVDAVCRFEAVCKEKGYRTTRLPVSAAFHSSLMSDAYEPFLYHLRKAEFHPTSVPVYSNTTAEPYPQDPSAIITYLSEHILLPVDFIREIENMAASGIRTFIEVGPKSVLTGMVNAILNKQDIHAISLDSSAGKRSGISDLARALCHIASLGHFVELKNWEHPYQEQRKQIMSIPISGANYRAITNPETQTPKNRQNITAQLASTNTANNPMNTSPPSDPDIITNALKTIQDALKTMQSLQMQTAETHKKFLEAQAENSRILKTLVDSTRKITEDSLGITLNSLHFPADNQISAPSISGMLETSIDHENRVSDLNKTPDKQKAPPIQQPMVDSADKEKSISRPAGNAVKKILIDVVSHLTGYPAEMLGLDMDMEADLGIDSIKKVEILSTLEECIPNLPQISPDMIGSLKTLGQIAEYLSYNSSDPLTMQPSPASALQPEESAGIRYQNPAHTDTEEIKKILLDIVCQLTGYPIEMLGLDMDMEADLGIDSIKKVEILSALEENIPNLPRVSPETIGSLKTLGQIVNHLSSNGQTENGAQVSDTTRETENVSTTMNDSSTKISRKIITIIQEPIQEHPHIPLPKEKKIFVTDDGCGLSKAIVHELKSLGINTAQISIHNKNMNHLAESACGLILVQNPETRLSDRDIKDIFLVAKNFAPHLIHAAQQNTAVFAAISRMDGMFGFGTKTISNPEHGALAALVKTASLEWENVVCRSLDIDCDVTSYGEIAKNAVFEILNSDPSGPVEIGLSAESRAILSLQPSPAPTGDIHLGRDDVIIVTGGARGITAECILALAKLAQPTLILFGRSPLPAKEPDWLKPVHHHAEIKKAILANTFKDKKITPAQLEKVFHRVMANREINETIRKIEKAGSIVKYYCVDILNKNSVTHAISEIKSLYGSVSGIIHGAGVLADRLITDKTLEQFEAVFRTKVTGLKNLLKATAGDKLKYLVLFSSIAARTGNKGQVDYAMANEVLNKIAIQEASNRPECRVVSINWGPWDGGMVSPSLKKEFHRNHIELIPMEKGPQCMLDEMRGSTNHPVEVVIGASSLPTHDVTAIKPMDSPHPVQPQPSPDTGKHFSLTFKREIDVKNYPILNSHILDGTPVVPFALISEWLGYGALHGNPGLYLYGMDDMRVLKGIRLDQESKIIRLMAGKAKKIGSVYEVDVELRDGFKGDADIIHSKAKAILADTLSTPPEFSLNHHPESKAFPMSIDEIYEKVLFHGSELRGIKEISRYSSHGMVARVVSAPAPAMWMTQPLRNKWISDPLVLDCAFQMATLWCYMEKGVVSLPSYNASYRQYRTKFPDGDITAVLDVTHTTEHKMRGNFTFLDQNSTVIARLEGYEAIMDASLFKSFKPHFATASTR